MFRRVIGKIGHIYTIYKSSRKIEKGKVLMMHSIDTYKEEFTISPSDFERLLKFLSSKKVISLQFWENEKDFYAITFDDVPESFYLNAFPLLKEKNIPFTIFVNTSLLDTEGYITSSQLKEMSECELCTVGSHGVSHSFYHRFNRQQALNDLRKSRISLEQIIGKPVELFAFPYGSYSACGFKNKHLVTEIYKYGFGTVACPITEPLTLPKYFLPRINVDSNYIEKV